VSALAEAVADYLELRRSFGYKLDEAGRLLPRFVVYLDSVGADVVTIENAVAWAQQPQAAPGTTVWAARMSVARGFARYLAGIDARTQVPPPGLISSPRRRRNPFIYTAADITSLQLEAQRQIPTPLRAATVATVIGLLGATGMRVGEVLRLDRDDIDWDDAVIWVRQTKFNKQRLLPLHPTTVAALAGYATQRDQLLRSAPKTPGFFVSTVGTRLIYVNLNLTFKKLVDGAGIARGSAVTGRIHDLRHSFAVRTLLEWYRQGDDVQACLPWLSTYLGHREPRYTYTYLSAIPELLAIAAERLESSTPAVWP